MGLVVLAKYTEVRNDIKFEEVLVQMLEEKKRSVTLRYWKAKINCYCISVNLPPFIPQLNARIDAAKNVN